MRCLRILGSLGIVLTLMNSCVRPDPAENSLPTIHYYQFSLPNFNKTFSVLQKSFQKIHPGIRVRVHTLPTSTDEQHQFYLTHLSSRGTSRIDVFAIDVIWMAELARAGLLMPLDEEFSDWEQFFQSSVEAATYRGKRYAVPYFIDGGILYSRKDLLQKHGYRAPPATWQELIAVSQDILNKENNPDLRGFVWQGKQYEGLICNFIEHLPVRSPNDPDQSKTFFGFRRASMRIALQEMRDLVYKHGVSPVSVFSMSEEESRHVFHNGNAVFMRNWPYAWRLAQQPGSPVAGKIQVSALPSFEKGVSGKGALGGFLLGIHRDTPYPEASRAWVEFLTGPAAQKILWENLGLTPARKNVFSNLKKPGDFPLEYHFKLMDQTVPRPVSPVYIPVSQSMQAYISGALVGVHSIEESLRLMESDAQRIFRILNEG